MMLTEETDGNPEKLKLFSPEYIELQRKLHREQDKYGTSSRKRSKDILAALQSVDGEDILDYGCGKGMLKEAIGGNCVREYDPAISGKDGEPEPADLVVCTDVLEHIEPDCIDDVLLHIRTKTKKAFYFTVNLVPARKTLADGRNAHILLESASWWREKIGKFFYIKNLNKESHLEIVGLALPLKVFSPVKSVGVMRDERIIHVRQNVLKTPKRNPDVPLPPHPGIALIANYGPSLKDTFELLRKMRKKLGNATLVSVSGAHDFLRKRNLTPDIHIECDPRAHKGKMMRKRSKDTKYYMASCCHPDVIDSLEGYDLTLWHLYNGPESFEIRDIRSEETCSMIPGGGSVGLRAITLLYFLGFRTFLVHGMDCSFEDGGEQHAGAHSGKVQKTVKVNPAIEINGKTYKSEREFTTSPVLTSYANHMLKDLRIGRYPDCEFFWYGDGLFQEMLRLQNLQIKALTDAEAAQGIEPKYIAAKDYFSATAEEEQALKENAA
jgi:hypothetical protein